MIARRYLIGATLAALVAATGVWWQAKRAVETATEQVIREDEIRFTLSHWTPATAAGFEPISFSTSFVDALTFKGKVYIASTNALLEYSEAGELQRTFRCGLELPSAPLTALAAGELLGIATDGEGLLLFDGQGFEQFRPTLASQRSFTSVIWTGMAGWLIGTKQDGVFRFDGHAVEWLHANLHDAKVTVLQGEPANLWIGTRDKGVAHFAAGQLTWFTEADGMPDSHVLSLAASADAVFAGTPSGVAQFREGKFGRVIAPGFFATALAAHVWGLYVGTLEEGVMDVPASGRPNQITADGAVRRFLQIGDKWFAVSRNGFYSLAKGKSERLIDGKGALLADGNISALQFDSSGRLWVGYFDKGLDIVGADLLTAVHVEDSTVFCVNRILDEPARQSTTVATANGLVYFDSTGHPRQTLTKRDGLIATHVTDVVRTADGLAVGTPAGVTFLGTGGPHSLYAFHGLVNNHVYSLSAGDGKLLVGTLGGLSILEKETVRASFTTANSGLKHNWITAIASLGNQHYIGSYGGGVVRLDSSLTINTFPDMPKEIIINPNAMTHTPTAVYAGTLGHGLGVFNLRTGRWRWVETGLPSKNVTALTTHGDSIYIGTENGLVRVPEKNLEF